MAHDVGLSGLVTTRVVAVAVAWRPRFGTDEATFIELLCGASPAQNAAIARAYEDAFDHSLAKAVTSEFSGNLKVSHRRSLSCR